MGQYYRPIILENNDKRNDSDNIVEWFRCYDFDNGAKLMEHSYIGNEFVAAVANAIRERPTRLVWAGDYADGEQNLPKNEYDEHPNLYMLTDERTKVEKDRYDSKPSKRYKYLVNHTKGEFVDISKAPQSDDDWQVHPLPLLTCEGNGRGGGDYREENENIGIWARDLLSIESRKPKGMTERVPNFILDF